MKKIAVFLLALIMILSMAFALASCADKSEPVATEETVGETQDDQDKKSSEEETADSEETANIVKSFNPDSEEELGQDTPLQIESVTLYKDGTVEIIPTDDLRKNELGESEAESLVPFAESGKDEEGNDEKTGVVKDVFLMRIGSDGYRTVVALMENGTISAINPRALIEDHIVAVKDNVGGRDSFTGVEQEEGENGFSIVGKTEEGDDVKLDPVILTEDEEPEQVEQDD